MDKRSAKQIQAGWIQQLIGFGAVLSSTLTSGFAGVYFEKILKTGPMSVWIRNIQLGNFNFILLNVKTLFIFLAIPGTVFGLMIVFIFDYKAVMEKGFFHGYTTIVWLVVLLQVIDNQS